MLISIIVPVYNMAHDGMLEYSMRSLMQQTITDYEVIAVDDCSADDSYEILQRFAAEYPDRLKVLRTDRNRHQGGAKNLGLSIAAGEWIGFMDADDWVTPDFYERLLAKAKETGADCVGCDYCLTGEHSMRVGKQVHNNRPEQTGILDEEKYRSLMIDFGSLVVKIYRREIITGCESRFPEDIFYEDNALAKTWISRIRHFEYIPEPLYYYYQHSSSTVHTVTKKRLSDRMESGRIMLQEAKRYGYYERFLPELEFSFTVLFYKNTLFSCMRQMKEAGKYKFVTDLAEEMKKTFPDFRNNVYYGIQVDKEEQRMIDLQMRSPLAFYLYYNALWMYRDRIRPLLH